MAQYIYRIQPSRPAMIIEGPTVAEDAIISQHFTYLKNLTKQRVVLLARRTLTTDASSFGIIIFRAESEQAARAIRDNDPAFRQSVMRAELFPYRVALWSAPETD